MKRKSFFSIVTGLSLVPGLLADSVVSQRLAKGDKDLERYNLKLGELFVDSSYKMTLGYDDNSNTSSSSSNREEGFYVINGMDLGFYAPISEDFIIDTDFFIGYKNWLSGNNTDGLIVDVNSGDTLAFDWRVNEKTTISLVDRLQIGVQEIEESSEDENSDEQRILKNDLGLQLFQELNEQSSYGIKAGLNMVKSLNDKFEERERDETYIGAEFNQKVGSKLTLSPYFVFREYDFDKDINNDAEEWQLGLTLKGDLSENLYAQLSLGWQQLDFDGNLEDDKEGGLEGSLLINQQLSEDLDHSLYIRHNKRVSQSAGVNFSKDWLFSYNFGCQVSSSLILTPKLTYFVSEDKVSDGEEYDVLMPGLSLAYKISEILSFELDYLYSEKNSDTDSEYDRTEVFMSFIYDF
ncbi:MAG: hypothetical protein NE334_15070 [Lentisphaeraceae bacterium]|nr:hypothetical protein [Lentisphaeraceae bacterium]